MRIEPLKLPKQLSFPFMKELEIETKAILSKQEHNELIQALTELIIAYAKTENLIKIMELHDEH